MNTITSKKIITPIVEAITELIRLNDDVELHQSEFPDLSHFTEAVHHQVEQIVSVCESYLTTATVDDEFRVKMPQGCQEVKKATSLLQEATLKLKNEPKSKEGREALLESIQLILTGVTNILNTYDALEVRKIKRISEHICQLIDANDQTKSIQQSITILRQISQCSISLASQVNNRISEVLSEKVQVQLRMAMDTIAKVTPLLLNSYKALLKNAESPAILSAKDIICDILKKACHDIEGIMETQQQPEILESTKGGVITQSLLNIQNYYSSIQQYFSSKQYKEAFQILKKYMFEYDDISEFIKNHLSIINDSYQKQSINSNINMLRRSENEFLELISNCQVNNFPFSLRNQLLVELEYRTNYLIYLKNNFDKCIISTIVMIYEELTDSTHTSTIFGKFVESAKTGKMATVRLLPYQQQLLTIFTQSISILTDLDKNNSTNNTTSTNINNTINDTSSIYSNSSSNNNNNSNNSGSYTRKYSIFSNDDRSSSTYSGNTRRYSYLSNNDGFSSIKRNSFLMNDDRTNLALRRSSYQGGSSSSNGGDVMSYREENPITLSNTTANPMNENDNSLVDNKVTTTSPNELNGQENGNGNGNDEYDGLDEDKGKKSEIYVIEEAFDIYKSQFTMILEKVVNLLTLEEVQIHKEIILKKSEVLKTFFKILIHSGHALNSNSEEGTLKIFFENIINTWKFMMNDIKSYIISQEGIFSMKELLDSSSQSFNNQLKVLYENSENDQNSNKPQEYKSILQTINQIINISQNELENTEDRAYKEKLKKSMKEIQNEVNLIHESKLNRQFEAEQNEIKNKDNTVKIKDEQDNTNKNMSGNENDNEHIIENNNNNNNNCIERKDGESEKDKENKGQSIQIQSQPKIDTKKHLENLKNEVDILDQIIRINRKFPISQEVPPMPPQPMSSNTNYVSVSTNSSINKKTSNSSIHRRQASISSTCSASSISTFYKSPMADKNHIVTQLDKEDAMKYPIKAAACDLKIAASKWKLKENPIIDKANLIAQKLDELSYYHQAVRSEPKTKKMLLRTAQEIMDCVNILKYAKEISESCTDKRLKHQLLNTVERINTLEQQLKVVIAVKSGSRFDLDSDKQLVTCASNIAEAVKSLLRDSEAASLRSSIPIEYPRLPTKEEEEEEEAEAEAEEEEAI